MSSRNEFIKINRRSLMKGTVLILIGVLISSCYFVAADNIGNQNYPTAYNSGGPSGGYDYLIFTFTNNTGTYYASKDSFGRVVDAWTSTNASYTVQSTFNAVPTKGGTVQFLDGLYPIDVTISRHAPINIFGQSVGIEFDDNSGVVFKWTGVSNSLMFNFSNAFTVNMERCKLNGDYTDGASGILLGGLVSGDIPWNRTRNMIWEQVDIYRFNGTGLILGRADYEHASDDTKFTKLTISNCGVGIDTGGYEATMVIFEACKIRRCTTGVLMRDGAALIFNTLVCSANFNDFDFAVGTSSHTYIPVVKLYINNAHFENTVENVITNTGNASLNADIQINTMRLYTQTDAVFQNLTNFYAARVKNLNLDNDFHTQNSIILPNNNNRIIVSCTGRYMRNITIVNGDTGIPGDITSALWKGWNGQLINIVNQNLTGNPTTTYTSLFGSTFRMPIDTVNTKIIRATITITWDPGTSVGGIQLYDVTRDFIVANKTGPAAGITTTTFSINLETLSNVFWMDYLELRTKGNNSVAPEIYSVSLELET